MIDNMMEKIEEKITATSIAMDGLHVHVTYNLIDTEENTIDTFNKSYVIASGKKDDAHTLISNDKEKLENAVKLKEKLEEEQ